MRNTIRKLGPVYSRGISAIMSIFFRELYGGNAKATA